MPSSQDAQAQPKRPAVLARHSSTSSYMSQSPSEGHSSPRQRAGPHKPQRHVVGHSRMGPRNPSFGKNLNKLNKVTQAHGGEAKTDGKHHRRTLSGTSTPTASAPRPSMKRNASTVGIVRNTGHTHTVLRKNHSSGHLPRQGSSSKNVLKHTKSEVAPPRRSLMNKSRQSSPEAHPTVHFDMGEDEDRDDGWTEESASQSPTTTRSTTRQNSVILDSDRAAQTSEEENRPEPSETETQSPQSSNPPSPSSRRKADAAYVARQINGASSYHQSPKPPDADLITSRLLQRNTSLNAPPQTSSVSVVTNPHDARARTITHSQASTLADTPGKDLVSRFMDGDGSGGTPRDSEFLPHRPRTAASEQGGDLAAHKRNKSAPDMSEQAEGAQSRAPSSRSGTTTPTDLHPSRTQQKLWLQRASSNIEPQKLIPVILPRTGGPQLLGAGVNYASTGDRIDPRLQRQFDQVALEYKVVRRHRNPLADAIKRLEQMPGSPRKQRISKTPTRSGYLSSAGGDGRQTPVNGAPPSGRRGKVNFEVGHSGRDDGDVEGRQSFESDVGGSGRVRNEAEEMCRRLWESTELLTGGDD